MGLFLVAVLLWGLMITGLFLATWGLWKTSWKAFVWSGAAFILPSIILATQKGLYNLFLLLPFLVLGAAYITYKRKKG
ncbi:hypothetical protein [Bacillus tuaregi]|uniref:hypothetical protein n=1 Tax=Bacillus tuaregi TaxID=1816695 RepID=UPI0008F93756|nr:hypothetical protein [Bacillus tuaregi]